MTICNMSIEMGARGGLIAPDDITFEYLREITDIKPNIQKWLNLYSDDEARFDKEYAYCASDIQPMITYGTSPDTGTRTSPLILTTTIRARPARHSSAIAPKDFH